MNYKTLLNTALKENNLALSDDKEQKLIAYLDLMQAWNRVFNLTTITEPRDMIYLHLIDSLVVQPFLSGDRLLDVGTGAGLPGIPLAIADPEKKWILLDKNNKKIRFLRQVIAELNLRNIEAIHSRSEDFHPKECFDSILSRAFGTICLFAQTSEHLLCPNGKLIAMKGKYPEQELDNMPDHFKLQDVMRLNIKGINIERHIIRIVKHKRDDCG
jgi:16S rRNA (guanine527-N7)-methyltransferase